MENNLPKKDDVFTGTQVGVLIEEFRGKLDFVIDDLTSVKKTVNVINQELGRQKEDIFIIKADIRIIKNDIGDIKTTLGVHGGRLSRLEEAVLK